MRLRHALTIGLLVLAMGSTQGCSCDSGNEGDMGDGGGGDQGIPDLTPGGEDGMVIPSTDGGCTPGGAKCVTNAECCSGFCDGTGACGVPTSCTGNGLPCKYATDCCTLNCTNGMCGATQCVSDGQPCTVGGTSCCSTQCVSGSCKPLTTACKTSGNTCALATDCCSGVCDASKHCAAPSTISYCHQVNDICFNDNECCTGVCVKAAGSTAGTCAKLTNPDPSAQCKVDGEVCNGCSTSPRCCSGYCAPFGSGGSYICQEAGGCHVIGDLCLKDGDCCGSKTSMLPGEGEVKCVPDPTYPQIGQCSDAKKSNCTTNPNDPLCSKSCQPEGDVCHFGQTLGGVCPSNSYPADCCAAPGVASGECKLDARGVPRCFGLAACVMAGGVCSASTDCCNGVPCVPDAQGVLRCIAPNDMGIACVPLGGVCTATSDCCAGYDCVIPPGSLTGTCQNPGIPPADGGVDMAGVDLAGVDLAGSDLANPPMCSLYGQPCGTTPCCLNQGTCRYPFTAAGGLAGQPCNVDGQNCTCYEILP